MTKERKYILIGGMILLMAGAIYRFFPEVSVFDFNNAIKLKERRIIKYRKALEQKDKLEAKIKALTRAVAKAESGLLTGRTQAIAAVEIQNILNEIASVTGVEVKSMRVLRPPKPKPGDFLISVPIWVRTVGGINQIKKMLYKIENNRKILKITKFRIRVNNRKNHDEFQTEFTVTGFMKRKTG